MFFSSKRKGSGHRSSASSSSTSSLSSSRASPTSRHSDPKRHSLDSSTNASNMAHSGPIPRGNGHQAMSIPMPPPPSVYFSLLPSNNNGTSAGSHSNASSPRLGNKDIADRTLSKSASTKGRRSKQFPPHSDPSTPTVHHAFSFSPLHNSNNSSRSPSRSASNSRPSSNPNTPGAGAIPIASAGVYNHYHTHHHAPRPTYPLSMTFSRRSSISHGYGAPAGGANDKQG